MHLYKRRYQIAVPKNKVDFTVLCQEGGILRSSSPVKMNIRHRSYVSSACGHQVSFSCAMEWHLTPTFRHWRKGAFCIILWNKRFNVIATQSSILYCFIKFIVATRSFVFLHLFFFSFHLRVLVSCLSISGIIWQSLWAIRCRASRLKAFIFAMKETKPHKSAREWLTTLASVWLWKCPNMWNMTSRRAHKFNNIGRKHSQWYWNLKSPVQLYCFCFSVCVFSSTNCDFSVWECFCFRCFVSVWYALERSRSISMWALHFHLKA